MGPAIRIDTLMPNLSSKASERPWRKGPDSVNTLRRNQRHSDHNTNENLQMVVLWCPFLRQLLQRLVLRNCLQMVSVHPPLHFSSRLLILLRPHLLRNTIPDVDLCRFSRTICEGKHLHPLPLLLKHTLDALVVVERRVVLNYARTTGWRWQRFVDTLEYIRPHKRVALQRGAIAVAVPASYFLSSIKTCISDVFQ